MSFLDELVLKWTTRKVIQEANEDEYATDIKLIDYIVTNDKIKLSYNIIYKSHLNGEIRYKNIKTEFGRHPEWDR